VAQDTGSGGHCLLHQHSQEWPSATSTVLALVIRALMGFKRHPAVCLSVCLSVCLAGCLAVWLAGWLAGWLAVCLAVWLAVWLAGWLAGLPAQENRVSLWR
jgi:hypothetical protein